MQRNLGVYKRRGPSHNCMLGNPIVRVHGVIESWPLGGPTFGLGRLGNPTVRATGFWPPSGTFRLGRLRNPAVRVTGFWPPGGTFGLGLLGTPAVRVIGFWPPGFWPPGRAFGHSQLGTPVVRVHGVFDFQEAAEKVE